MADTRTLEDVRNVVLSAHKNAGLKEKVAFYDTWAESYEQDTAILDYRAPFLAAECIVSYFTGEKERAIILDVACGTGLVSGHLKKMGFHHFVGVDGSEKMLNLAMKTGLYQELKQCMLCQDPLPVQADMVPEFVREHASTNSIMEAKELSTYPWKEYGTIMMLAEGGHSEQAIDWVKRASESYDVVVIVGALSIGNVPVAIVEELWQAIKPGGYMCMTTRGNADNLKYKAELECVLRAMEEESKWSRVAVNVVEEWEKAVSEHESGYIPGIVYLYQRVY